MFNDKILTCRDCGQEFVFSASEQEFFAEKGFTNEPGRCPQCRAEKRLRIVLQADITITVKNGKCSLPPVLHVERKPQFRFDRLVRSRYIVGIASIPPRVTIGRHPYIKTSQVKPRRFFLF